MAIESLYVTQGVKKQAIPSFGSLTTGTRRLSMDFRRFWSLLLRNWMRPAISYIGHIWRGKVKDLLQDIALGNHPT
jgi:hypothetical protein